MTQPVERAADRDRRRPGASRDPYLGSTQYTRARRPHRTRSTLRALRAELVALYEELSAALLPTGRGKR